ncbi:MAG: ABC transporter ATP-binding protein [Anaerolineales bacterium]|jgi:ABC-type lipoprotein export system ATPase subunit
MKQASTLVETIDLIKIYPPEVRALDGLSLSIGQGEFLAIMGPSGSGKTTLLNLLAALDRPTSGEVVIAGERLSEVRDLDRFRSRTVGLVFQMHNLIPSLNASENIEVPMVGFGMRRRARRNRSEELLASVGLDARGGHHPAALSGGERQRVAIARALANQPALLLADEPTGNLDSVSGAEVMDVFRFLNREAGVTVLVVTHDPAVARAADRIVTLHDGRVVRDEQVGDPYLADLRAFKASGLGKALAAGKLPPPVKGLGFDAVMPSLSRILADL